VVVMAGVARITICWRERQRLFTSRDGETPKGPDRNSMRRPRSVAGTQFVVIRNVHGTTGRADNP